MKSIIWKELRENAMWAVIGMIVFSLALLCAWSSTQSRYNYDGYKSLCHPMVLLVTLFGGPLIGIALGFLQIIPEQLRDRWAFLIHRPIPAATIYAGKALAGVILYLFATLPPYLFLCWWASRPGHVPGPFHPGLMIGSALYLGNGVIFYLAAVATAMRPARWLGTKTFPILAVLFLATLNSYLYDWPTVIAMQAGGIVLVTLLGVRSFDAHDKITRGQSIQFGAETIVLYTGIFVLVGLSFALIQMIQGPQYGDYREYRILGNGQIVQSVSTDGVAILKDLQGNTLPFKPRYNEEDPNKRELQWNYAYLRKNSFERFSQRDYTAAERWIGNAYQGYEETSWFYIEDKGYFANYSRYDKQLKGYLAPGGFSEREPQGANRFHGAFRGRDNANAGATGLIGNTVYWIDFGDTKVQRLFDSESPADKVASYIIGEGYNSKKENLSILSLDLVSNQLAVFLLNGKELFHTPIHKDLKQFPHLRLTKLEKENRIFIHYKPGWDDFDKRPSYIVELDATGTVVRETQLPPEPRSPYVWHWIEAYQYVIGNLTLKGYEIGSLRIRAALGDEEAIRSWNHRMTKYKRELREIAIFVAVAALCAYLGRRRMKRHAFPASRIRNWTIFIFLTGPVGLLTLLAQEIWPVSEPCPACGKRRLITLERCGHCNAAWPEPAKDGTEIVTVA